jgi:hypothetical protein
MRVEVSHILSVIKIGQNSYFRNLPIRPLSQWPLNGLKWVIRLPILIHDQDLIPGLQKSVKELTGYAES